MVGHGDRLQVKVAHAVDLKLEGEGWLQVAVDQASLNCEHRLTQLKISGTGQGKCSGVILHF